MATQLFPSDDKINCSHTLGKFGDLHVVQLDPRHVNSLREFCTGTSCDATHVVGKEDGMLSLIDPIVKLIQQKNSHEPVLLTKLPDGYVAHTPSNVVLSLIKDDYLTQPANGNEDGSVCVASHNGKIISYSLVNRPDQSDHSAMHFKLVKDHDGVLPPNCITNFTPIDHALAKVAAAIPLSEKSRVIFASPNMGSLHGYHLKGDSTAVLKDVFFNLIKKTKGQDMYDVPLKLPPQASALLGLNDPEGKICIAPMQNGIMGYRNRKTDDGQTLIFLANSNDFHQEKPLSPSDSVIQIFKMNYANKDKNSRRIYVNTRNVPHKGVKCMYSTVPITPNMSVQEALNHIEYSMRKSYMDHKNIGDYPHYCQIMQLIRQLDAT